MTADDLDQIELAYFRVPVRITRDDLERLDKTARLNNITVGYYLDLVVAEKANEVRRLAGEPEIPSPLLNGRDRWRNVRPS